MNRAVFIHLILPYIFMKDKSFALCLYCVVRIWGDEKVLERSFVDTIKKKFPFYSSAFTEFIVFYLHVLIYIEQLILTIPF